MKFSPPGEVNFPYKHKNLKVLYGTVEREHIKKVLYGMVEREPRSSFKC